MGAAETQTRTSGARRKALHDVRGALRLMHENGDLVTVVQDERCRIEPPDWWGNPKGARPRSCSYAPPSAPITSACSPAGLLKLLDAHGASALEQAIGDALAQDAPHLGAVRQLRDRRRHARGQPPPLPVPLPDDPRLRDLHVRPHPLTDYEQLQHREPDHDDNDNES